MGSPPEEEGRYVDETPHEVELTRGFWLGETEVTQAQWEAVMGSNPSGFRGADRPVEQVSWADARRFISRANAAAPGLNLRLPTEAEWEYAARAGSTEARYGAPDAVAWYSGNSGGETHPVGRLSPNRWGLYDMLGNVWEWCSDRYGAYSTGRAVDPTGVASGSGRVDRGGSWINDALEARASCRSARFPSYGDGSLGFRLARGP
jgi:sulfatase modifying factor 1